MRKRVWNGSAFFSMADCLWRKLSETEVGIQGITFSFLSGESQEVTLI